MYAQERHQAIAGLIRSRGRLAVSDVATEYGVTTETVRRDLAQLERVGVLRRVHGGAVAVSALALGEPGLADREATRTAEKDRIARAALDLLPAEGGSIALDAGTSTGRLARLLPSDRPLLVVTHAVPIAAGLAGLACVDLYLVGGRVRGLTQAAVGASTVRALSELRVDVVFLGTNALQPEHGLTTPDAEEADVKRALVAAGRQVVVLADSSKLGAEHLHRFALTAEVDVVVTDDEIDEEAVCALHAAGVEVVVA